MNEPEAVEKHCVTKFKDFEHWMESFIYALNILYFPLHGYLPCPVQMALMYMKWSLLGLMTELK